MKYAPCVVVTKDYSRIHVEELEPVAGNVYRVNRGPLLEYGVDELYDTEAAAFAAGRAIAYRMIARLTESIEETLDE